MKKTSSKCHQETPKILTFLVILQVFQRLRFTFTPNGKREFVLRDQVFPLIVVNCLLLQLKNKYFHASFIHKNCCGLFYLLIFYSEKFATWIWRLPFGVNVNLSFSINSNKTWKKLTQRFQSRFNPCSSLLSVATEDRKKFQCLDIVVNDQTGPLLCNCIDAKKIF